MGGTARTSHRRPDRLANAYGESAEALQRLKRGGSLERLFHEPVAETDYRLDLRAYTAEFRAEPADVHVHRSRFNEAVVAPHALEQPIAREHAVAVFHEAPEQFELAPREPDRLAFDGHQHRIEIRDEMLAPIDRQSSWPGGGFPSGD